MLGVAGETIPPGAPQRSCGSTDPVRSDPACMVPERGGEPPRVGRGRSTARSAGSSRSRRRARSGRVPAVRLLDTPRSSLGPGASCPALRPTACGRPWGARPRGLIVRVRARGCETTSAIAPGWPRTRAAGPRGSRSTASADRGVPRDQPLGDSWSCPRLGRMLTPLRAEPPARDVRYTRRRLVLGAGREPGRAHHDSRARCTKCCGGRAVRACCSRMSNSPPSRSGNSGTFCPPPARADGAIRKSARARTRP